jgi:lysophospholipase L1-like esterase
LDVHGPGRLCDRPYWISTGGNGTVTILGQENLTANSGVRIDRTANGGWGVNNFLQRDSTFDMPTKTNDPDLVTVWLGQNDQAFDRTSYAQKLELLLTRIRADKPGVPVVFIGTYDQGSPLLKPLVDAMADVAQSENIGFINLYDTASSSTFMNQMAYLADGIHFSPTGSAYMGNFLYQTFLTDGANLTPEPSLLGFADILGIGLLMRPRKRLNGVK